jgi:hypothetical protein
MVHHDVKWIRTEIKIEALHMTKTGQVADYISLHTKYKFLHITVDPAGRTNTKQCACKPMNSGIPG